MSDIQIGVVGHIITGDEAGSFVRIIDDKDNTGGFIILISNDYNFRNGHDSWVEDAEALRRYVYESGWMIDWHCVE